MYVADGDGTSLAQKKSSEKDPASLDGMAQKRKFARQTSLPIRSSALFCMLTIYFLFSPFADHSSRRVSNPTDEGRGGKSRATDHPTPFHSTLYSRRKRKGRHQSVWPERQVIPSPLFSPFLRDSGRRREREQKKKRDGYPLFLLLQMLMILSVAPRP